MEENGELRRKRNKQKMKIGNMKKNPPPPKELNKKQKERSKRERRKKIQTSLD